MIKHDFVYPYPTADLRIDHIEVMWVDDDDLRSSSNLGEYSDTPRTGAIDCSTRSGYEPPQFRYWNPANPDLEHPEYIEQDFARHEALCRGEWSYQGCIARAVVSYPTGGNSRRLEILSSSGLFGIESDSSPLYILEAEIEQLLELRDHVQKFSVPWTAEQEDLLRQAQDNLRTLQNQTRVSELAGEGSGQAVNVHSSEVGREGGG